MGGGEPLEEVEGSQGSASYMQFWRTTVCPPAIDAAAAEDVDDESSSDEGAPEETWEQTFLASLASGPRKRAAAAPASALAPSVAAAPGKRPATTPRAPPEAGDAGDHRGGEAPAEALARGRRRREGLALHLSFNEVGPRGWRVARPLAGEGRRREGAASARTIRPSRPPSRTRATWGRRGSRTKGRRCGRSGGGGGGGGGGGAGAGAGGGRRADGSDRARPHAQGPGSYAADGSVAAPADAAAASGGSGSSGGAAAWVAGGAGGPDPFRLELDDAHDGAIIRTANEEMGLPATGMLPAQVAALYAAIGIDV